MSYPSKEGSILLIQESPMQFLPTLAMVTSEACALFAQQLQYWLQYSRNVREGRRWVYNTLEEWSLQFPWWSVSKLRRVIATLQDVQVQGEHFKVLLVDSFNQSPLDHRKWYTLDYDELNRLAEVARVVMAEHKCRLVLGSSSLQRKYTRLAERHFELPPTLDELYAWGDEHKVVYAKMDGEKPVKEAPIDASSSDVSKTNKSICSKPANRDVSRVRGDFSPRFVQNEHIDLPPATNRIVQNEQIDMFKMNKPTIIQETTLQETSLHQTGVESSSVTTKKMDGWTDEEIQVKSFSETSGIPIREQDQTLFRFLLATYGVEPVREAIALASSYQAHTLTYVYTILKNEKKSLAKKGESVHEETADDDRYSDVWKKYGF